MLCLLGLYLKSRGGWKGRVVGMDCLSHLYVIASKSTVQRALCSIFVCINGYNGIKVQIALYKGKNVRDKWQTIKERDAKREEQ